MTDPSTGGSGVTEKSAVDRTASGNVLDLENLVPGRLWRGIYQVRKTLPDITYGKMLAASHAVSGDNVVLRSFRVADQTRAKTWSQLSEYTGGGLIPRIEAVDFDGRRVEVTRALDAQNLASWYAGKPVEEKTLRSVLRQIAEVAIGLHEKSVAHLNLKPQTILIETFDREPRVKIAGLEAAADFSRPGLISISVDPFYAPPEAIGLLQHHCVPALRAWDWWSVGRIIQELVFGRHILGLILNRDVTRRTPELLMRAERVLLEKETAGLRAGGVEAMPAMSAEITTLLRGLLSSSREARWGASEVQRWLRGEPVKDRYDLSVHERLFVWKDRAFPLSEAAEYFSEAEHWPEALENIFGGGEPGTLLAFMAEDSGLRETHRRIQNLVKLPDSSAFGDIDATASRDVMTGIALATLLEGRLPLQVRGQRIDMEFVAACLGPTGPANGLSLVQALTERTAVLHISQVDVNASRLLAEFERNATAAVALAAQRHWISRADRTAWARLLFFTLMSQEELRKRRETLRSTYAVSRDGALDQLLKKTEPSLAELTVLAFVGEQPERYQLVTHRSWTAEQYRAIQEKGEAIATAATWVYLARALRVGPHLVGPWPLVLIFWISLGTPLALALPGRFTLGLVIALAIAACGARPILSRWARRDLRHRVPSATKLLTANQAEDEARRVLRVPESPSLKALKRSLADLDMSIAKLPSKERLARVKPPTHFSNLLFASLASGIVLLGAFAGFGYKVVKHPPSAALLLSSWFHPADQATLDAKKAKEAKRAAAAADELAAKARKNRRKSDQGNDIKVSWSFRPSPNPQVVRVTKIQEPTADQNREAKETGEYLVRPYTTATINDLIALRVAAESGVGLMLYDGKAGKVADKRLFVVNYVPLPRSWILLGDRRAIFLDQN